MPVIDEIVAGMVQHKNVDLHISIQFYGACADSQESFETQKTLNPCSAAANYAHICRYDEIDSADVGGCGRWYAGKKGEVGQEYVSVAMSMLQYVKGNENRKKGIYSFHRLISE